MARLSRYHNRCERTLFRNIKQLKDLQTERVLRDAFMDAQAVVPLLVSVTDLAKRTQPKSLPGGPKLINFDFTRPANRRAAPKTAAAAPPETLPVAKEVPAAA